MPLSKNLSTTLRKLLWFELTANLACTQDSSSNASIGITTLLEHPVLYSTEPFSSIISFGAKIKLENCNDWAIYEMDRWQANSRN
jgi:hypothetical protein